MLGVQKVPGSNPGAPTILQPEPRIFRGSLLGLSPRDCGLAAGHGPD